MEIAIMRSDNRVFRVSGYLACALAALATASAAIAQIREPVNKKYEVVSVKGVAPGDSRICGFAPASFSSPVQFTIEHCPLSTLIRYAFGTLEERMAGLPGWARSASYTVSAKSASPVSIGEKYAMLQPVLEERFHLKWHREMRQFPVYFLSAASGGIKLKKTVPGSCTTFDPKVGPPAPDPKKPPVCALWMNRVLPDGGRTLEASGVPMSQLAAYVADFLGRPGLDSTGSRDLYDVHLEFAKPELGAAGEANGATDAGVSAPPGNGPAKQPVAAASTPSNLPSLFSALKKVGLTLKAGKGPLEVLVVDSVQKPTEN
jgi:uncharacterized protein (TIGR03435 family)